MFRPIKKRKNEIDRCAAEKLLQHSRRGVLAVNGDDGYPYAVPINYFYDKDVQKIYFHGARVGHKVDALRACDKVCFTVYGNETVKEESWAPFMQSVVVFGKCRLVENGSKSTAILKQFAMKYYPDEQTADEEIARAGKATQIFEIEIEHLSGKEIQER
ncbi:MAG: pyridoxamine 5'-phosphate oxidase family protein [Clostridia bacterium]|nr:pyridoxamine 5'-phosphate oxidase family protein [Clostridia bacterium]